MRVAARIAFIVACIPLLYVAAAVIGALLARNAGWQEPETGIEIFVRTNGVHCDLVLPAAAAGVDIHALAPPEHTADPRAAGGWVAIGWGQREFYLETETWADLRIGTTLDALTGGDALMHVDHGPRPAPSATHRRLRVAPAGYRRMTDAVARAFRRDERRATIPLLGRGYGENDVFYEAHGAYHAFRTSNQWTADMLAEAGVRIGVWTPFEQSVMWRFER